MDVLSSFMNGVDSESIYYFSKVDDDHRENYIYFKEPKIISY